MPGLRWPGTVPASWSWSTTRPGRHQLTVDDARTSLPLALYALAAGRVLRRSCRRVELHHLTTGRVLAWEHTEQSLDRQLRRAEDIAGECAEADEQYRRGLPADRRDEVFPPRPGSWCGWCDYRGQCPEGMAAAGPRRPWDGLAAEPARRRPAGPAAAGRSAGAPADPARRAASPARPAVPRRRPAAAEPGRNVVSPASPPQAAPCR